MALTTDKAHVGMDLSDLLFLNTDETTSCHSNPSWAITIHDTLSPDKSGADDFLDTLLGGSDSSSAPASPLWSPCTTDSDVYEEAPSDGTSSPRPASHVAFPAFEAHLLPQISPPEIPPGKLSSETASDVSIDLGWETGGLQEQLGIAYYLSANQSATQSLTVKDLLLSNLGQRRIPPNSLQELVLNEDEKKLLAKEGVKLPSKLPLSKFEERVLKKIRRKIRNKRSAQESRKKKREYVDSLEGRMSACSTHNLQLQRKIQQLEETNNALLEQLSRLQALLPHGKTKQRGTCILVLLLSFSLLISSNLQPDASSRLGRGQYTESKVPSRSLQSVDTENPPPPALLSIPLGFQALQGLTEKLWLWTRTPATGPSLSSLCGGHRPRDHL